MRSIKEEDITMAISVSGRVVKVRPKKELKRIESKQSTRLIASQYNHIRIQFADNSDRSFLFTDGQIERAIKAAKSYTKTEMPKMTWVREFWFDDCIEVDENDVKEKISQYDLPSYARRINHVRISYKNKDIHLFFSTVAMQKALNRAKQEKQLPKVSWVSDNTSEKLCQNLQVRQGLEKVPKVLELQETVSY